jgi:hypothetical protein
MVAAVLIGVAIPWLTPLSFGLHAQGWHTGRSGTFYTTVGPAHARVPMSAAWAANVRLLDRATSDPPNKTLQRLPPRGIVVWARIQARVGAWPPDHRRVSVRYALADAYRFACCKAANVRGGEWELYGFGPKRAYDVLIRIYWGSRPTKHMKAQAERALRGLRLPKPRD